MNDHGKQGNHEKKRNDAQSKDENSIETRYWNQEIPGNVNLVKQHPLKNWCKVELFVEPHRAKNNRRKYSGPNQLR